MKKSTFHKIISRNYEINMLTVIVLLVLSPWPTFANDPDCTGIDRWPTNMAFVHLKNAGITDNKRIDFAKTKTIRLASEKIGKALYRQIHHITFIEKSGNTIEVITCNEASTDECSMSGVDVFVISRHLGGD